MCRAEYTRWSLSPAVTIFRPAGEPSTSAGAGRIGVCSEMTQQTLCYNDIMATYEITAKTTITARPDDVWAVLDNFSGWPTWMPALQNVRVELLSPGPPRMGYRFRLQSKLIAADLEVTGYSHLERKTRFRLNFPPISGANCCLLIPLDEGRYQLERKDLLDLPGPVASFLDATQRQRFEHLAAEFLATLRSTVERRAAHADIRATH